jgi:tRNA pseudouridine55 synthase
MQIGGVRAYELARAGKISRLEPRPVVIYEIRLERYAFPLVTLRVRCGKGTYIRSLARDLGVVLGTGGVLSGLRRTAVGPYTDDQAVALESLPREMTQRDLLPPPG